MHDDKVMKSLYKKAVGYNVEEESCEYSQDNELIKRKINTKHIPPDLSALKLYLEIRGTGVRFCDMNDEELIKERDRLLKELSELKIPKIKNKKTINK